MLKRMMIHKAITRNQYVKPFILFEEIEQDGKLCAGSVQVEGGGPEQDGKDNPWGSKSATFIFEENENPYSYEDNEE